MGNPLSILADPAEAYRNILDHPKWRTSFAFLSFIFFILTWLGGCWNNLSDAFQWRYLLGPALISPLIVGIVTLVSTAVLYFLVVLFGGINWRPGVFRTMFSLNTHCGVIVLLGEVANFLVVRASVFENMRFPLPGRFPIGLDVLLLGVDQPNLYVAILLHSTSLFIVWYLAVLSRGMHEVIGVSRARSVMLAAGLWFLTVVCALGLVYALGGGRTIRIKL